MTLSRISISTLLSSRVQATVKHRSTEAAHEVCDHQCWVTSDGDATNPGMYGHGVRTGTEWLIPCPRDQEILTSNWGESGCPSNEVLPPFRRSAPLSLMVLTDQTCALDEVIA